MLGKLYFKVPSFYWNQLLFLSKWSFAHVPRPVGNNDESIIQRIKNKKLAKYGKVRRFWDFQSSAERPPPTGIYRGGMIETDFIGLDDRVKQAYSLNNASPKEMQKARLEVCKHRFGNGKDDTGSAGMQAAVFCEKTIGAVKHLQSNHKDSRAIRAFLKLMVRRRRALLYLKIHNFQKYAQLIHYYGIKDISTGLHKKHFHWGQIVRCKNRINA